MTWTPEQEAQRREWGLDPLDAADEAVTESYRRDLERIAERDAARQAARDQRNGHSLTFDAEGVLTPPDDEPLYGERPRLEDLVVNIETYRASVPTDIPWICQPVSYSGGVSLVTGPPKAGKSTFTAQLQRCCETGEDFIGAWPVRSAPCLLVTEEGGVAVVHKTNGLRRLDVLDRRTAVRSRLSFAQMLEVVAEWSGRNPAGIAFIDTLAIWAEIQNENDASEASKAVALVTALAQATDLSVVLIHHARKGGGDHGEAIRGSGAIFATVDIAVELSRVTPGSDERWLDVQGRVILPERHLLSFNRDSMTYQHEDRSSNRLEEIETDLVGVPSDGDGLTRADLAELWKRDPRKRIQELLDVGRLRESYVKAPGKRTPAYYYWSIPAAWTPALETVDD